jgi:hypothetical protein
MSDEAFAEYIELYSLTDEQKEALMRYKDAICEMAAAVSEFLADVVNAVIKAFDWLSENLRSLWDRVQEELDKIPPPAKKPYLSHRHEKQVFLYKTPYIPRRIYRVQHR